MKNQFRYTATHRDGPHRDGRTVAMAPTPPPSAGGGGGNKSKSYLDDLMSGSVNFMDVQRAKTSSSMRSAGTSSSTARGTPQSHGLSGGRDDFGTRTTKPTTTTTPYGGPSSTSSSIQEADLEAFFKDSRKVTTTTVKDEGRPSVGGGGGTTKAMDDVFGDLGAFASGASGVTVGGSGNVSRAPRRETTTSKTTSGSDLDDLFTGSRRGDVATGG